MFVSVAKRAGVYIVRAEQALRSGYQAHIAKPVEPAELVKAIAELTGAGPSGSAPA